MNSSTTNLVLASEAAIDLHLHTTYSDGSWTPEQLLDYLVREHSSGFFHSVLRLDWSC